MQAPALVEREIEAHATAAKLGSGRGLLEEDELMASQSERAADIRADGARTEGEDLEGLYHIRIPKKARDRIA